MKKTSDRRRGIPYNGLCCRCHCCEVGKEMWWQKILFFCFFLVNVLSIEKFTTKNKIKHNYALITLVTGKQSGYA